LIAFITTSVLTHSGNLLGMYFYIR